ncbi:glycine betaine ABC transporter substrate-binding protein [Paenalcaligenes sp. Me131]|uniref:glycine betaine ABC transporter substrate-binding protein n=1 Tax=Paenalcaligenes sp. Me131 TaxID=3392636 RepID=UPI003D2E7B51
MGTAVFGLGLLGTSSAYAQDKGTVHLAYVEWSSEVASTNVMRVLLEQAGYDVKMSSLTGAAMWQAVANGDADAMLAAWLPTTHEDYFEQLGDKVEDLGPNLDGTKLGLVVPAYTEITSIEELNDNAKKFNNEIIGIDPGAGLQRLTGDVVDQYELKLRLRDGTDATMTAALANAIQNKEDVVITAWTPHWMFARWDLKYLEDPKGVYGGAEQIHTIARKGLKDDKPEAYAILDAFNWTTDDMGEIMLMNEEAGSDPYENAKKWVEANPEKVQAWMPATE